MENKNITIADIFLDILSHSQNKGTKIMAERMKAIIRTPEISELMNICVVNVIGYKSRIKEKIVDTAIDGIIDFVHAEIDCSNITEDKKSKEKMSYKCFAKRLGDLLKKRLEETNQLEA